MAQTTTAMEIEKYFSLHIMNGGVENLSGRCSELLFHNQKVFNIKMYHKS
jgi:hypothetical protein